MTTPALAARSLSRSSGWAGPTRAGLAVAGGSAVALATIAATTHFGLVATFGAAIGVSLVAWMILSERYELTLAVLLVYLACFDGFLKLRVGSSAVGLGRDVLVLGICLGAMARIAGRRPHLRWPPLTAMVVAFVCVALVQVANPASGSPAHAIASLRPHLEFVPLFFLGYATLRSTKRLRIFAVLILTVTLANGVVAFVQYGYTPDQLASWGPGYSRLVEGDKSGGLGARVSYNDNGDEHVRPPALGSDTGFGGNLAVLAAPCLLALLALERRHGARALALLLGGGVFLAAVTSQTRIAVVGAVVAAFAFAFLATLSRRGLRILFVTGVVVALGAVVVPAVSRHAGGDVLSRYASIQPDRFFGTSVGYKSPSYTKVPDYMGRFPLGAGLGSVGPATGALGGSAHEGVDAENEFNFLIIELGVPGVVVLFAFTARLVVGGARRVRRVRDLEERLLLTALVAGLGAIFFTWLGAPVNAGPPASPFFWASAGALSWWLFGGREREARPVEPRLAR
jgi:hypothetical protein